MAAEEGVKSVATNRRAGFDYELGTRYEAGIALSGGEIKSVRAGRMDLRDAFVIIRQGSAFLVNAYIPSYTLATGFNAHPDSALAMLAAAGWRRGADGVLRNAAGAPFRFELLLDKGNPTREQTALAIQQDLRKLGVDASLRTMEFAALVRDRILPGNFDAVLTWWTTPPDPDQYAFYHTGQDNNNVHWSNPVADSLLALGRATRDLPRRQAIYRAFQALELEDPPAIVLFFPREIQAVSSRLQGLPLLGIRDALRHSERFAMRAP